MTLTSGATPLQHRDSALPILLAVPWKRGDAFGALWDWESGTPHVLKQFPLGAGCGRRELRPESFDNAGREGKRNATDWRCCRCQGDPQVPPLL